MKKNECLERWLSLCTAKNNLRLGKRKTKLKKVSNEAGSDTIQLKLLSPQWEINRLKTKYFEAKRLEELDGED